MKKIVVLAVIGLYMAGCSKHVSPLQPDDGIPMAYYTFNGTANDVSGNGYDAVTHGTFWVPGRSGDRDSACCFDGEVAYVHIPYNKAFAFCGPFSIGVWFNMKSYTGEHNHLVARAGAGFAVWQEQNPYCIWVKRSTATLNFGMRGAVMGDWYGKTWCEVTAAFDSTQFGKWHHAVATYDGAHVMRLYVDGQLINSAAGPPQVFADTVSPVYIGADDNDGNAQADYLYAGLIDNVRFHRECLSEADIKAIYTLGL